MVGVNERTLRGIGVIGKFPPNPDHYTFKIVEELDPEKFAEYQEAVGVVGRINANLQIQLVEKNRARIASVSGFYRNAISAKQKSEHFHTRKAVENLSFDILNWLS